MRAGKILFKAHVIRYANLKTFEWYIRYYSTNQIV